MSRTYRKAPHWVDDEFPTKRKNGATKIRRKNKKKFLDDGTLSAEIHQNQEKSGYDVVWGSQMKRDAKRLAGKFNRRKNKINIHNLPNND